MLIRPAGPGDATHAARLILETPGGLMEVVGDARAALRMAIAAFRSPRTAFAFTRTLVADDGEIVGEVVRLAGADWPALRVATGTAMLRAAGLRAAVRLVRRGPVVDRLMPGIPPDALYVASLAVAAERRGRGIGADLMERVRVEAVARGFRAVALDVAARNEGAIRFYGRLGFVEVSEHRTDAVRGLPAMGSLRMELVLGGRAAVELPQPQG